MVLDALGAGGAGSVMVRGDVGPGGAGVGATAGPPPAGPPLEGAEGCAPPLKLVGARGVLPGVCTAPTLGPVAPPSVGGTGVGVAGAGRAASACWEIVKRLAHTFLNVVSCPIWWNSYPRCRKMSSHF